MLVKQDSLQNYFHNHIQRSVRKHNLHATEHTVVYLSNLLINFSRSENFFDTDCGRSPCKPLAQYYSESINSNSEFAKTTALRRLGDIALFICGFFSDSLKTKAVDIDYYISMGGSAYSYLSEQRHPNSIDTSLNNVFYDLSKRFIDYVDVISDLNDYRTKSNKNILRQYEVWLRTGSKKARKILSDSGIEPNSNSTNMLIQ